MFRSLITLMVMAGLVPMALPLPEAMRSPSFEPAALLQVSPVPVKVGESIAPDIEARSALLLDVATGIPLFEKNIHERLPMASLTKIMTALLILEDSDLDTVVTIEKDMDRMGDLGVRAWLRQYEKVTVRGLLTALLVPSAGDAAIALAVHHSGSVEAFVEAMNRRAEALNLRDTHFMNPIGLDENGHYSSVFDLSVLTRAALRYPEFRRIVRLPGAVVESVDGQFSHAFESTNKLLGSYPNILGVKTGTTDEAGLSVINLARVPQGHEVLTALLDSPARFQESKQMIDWSIRNVSW